MKTRIVKLILPFLLLSMACNLLSPQPAKDALTDELQNGMLDPDTATSDEAQEMNCVEMGLPCTPAEADPDALERGDEIYQELKTRLGEGESIESLKDWLEGMVEIRVVLSSPVSVMFILDGGLPLGVYDAVLAGGRGESDSGARSGGKGLASYRPPFSPPFSPVAEVVGHGTSRENDMRHKRALILSPFEFEYTILDAGANAKQILENIPDYKGRVTYAKNGEVGLDAFRGWNNYDLILYNGHGGVLTGTDSKTGLQFKTTFITTGDEQTNCDFQDILQGAGFSENFPPGVGCLGVSVRVENVFGRAEDVFRNFLSINPIFFSTEYPTGFEKAIIIFNGCVTFVSEFLPARLAGSSSVFFGWDQNVLSNFNPGVISSLLSEMAAGHPSEKALDEVCESSGCVDTAGKGAKLLRLAGGDDLRIREIAVSLHPLTGDPLTDGDKVPIYGYPGDGQVDELPFYIEVMGVEFDEIKNYTIQFEVNGQAVSGSWKLDNPESVEKWESPGKNTYRILDRMVLPFDFQQDQELNVVILVDLPEGGKSKSVKVKPLTRNPVFGLESFFGTEKNGAKIQSYVSAEVPLSLVEIKDDQVSFESIEQPDLLHYDAFEVSTPNCSVNTQTKDGTIDVLKAIFPKDGFTNIRFPIPDEFRFFPSQDLTESFELTCAGMTIPFQAPIWHPAFVVVNEKRLTDYGFLFTTWSKGSEGVYAEFHWESDINELDGEFTLRIREP